MTLSSFIDSPTFLDGLEISATDLNIMRRNAAIVDKHSRRGKRAFCVQGYPSFVTQFPSAGGPMRIWWGSFQMRTGLTTAGFDISTTPITDGGTKTLRILFDGVSKFSTVLTGSAQTHTPTIALTGYTDRQVVKVEVRIEFSVPPTLFGGSFICNLAWTDSYATTATTLYGAWPGVPTFGGTSVTATQLNQLSNALDWLANRLALVPVPLFQQQRYQITKEFAGTWPLWYGSNHRNSSNNRLRARFFLTICNNVAERFEILVNGTVAATSATYTLGQAGLWEPSIDISAITSGARFDIQLRSVVTTGIVGELVFSRYSLSDVWTEEATPAISAVPTEFGILESLTFTTLLARLNTIATMTLGAYNRIVAATDTFSRISMFRRRYVYAGGADGSIEGIDTMWATVQTPMQFRRNGDVLWVEGRGIGIGWGGIILKSQEKPNVPNWDYDTRYSEQLIPADQDQTKQVFLDAFDGLVPGSLFLVSGKDARYAAEELR